MQPRAGGSQVLESALNPKWELGMETRFSSDNPRVFLAVPFSESFQQGILGYQAALRSRFKAMHWIPAENFHLTVKFFGETLQEKLDKRILPRLEQLISAKPSFELCFKSFGWFGSHRQLRVLHLEGETPGLMELAGAVLREFPDERPRPFKAHLTLGKGQKRIEPQDIATNEELLRAWMSGGPAALGLPSVDICERITRLVLMESVFVGRAVHYEERAEFQLK
jgi:RNA 2',3'-cyclic 3'-phosphodiesterase